LPYSKHPSEVFSFDLFNSFQLLSVLKAKVI